LRSVDFGESDRIVHLLTPRTGRLTVIAKGARRSVKRFGGNLDLCNHLRIHVERRRRMSMARIEHALLIDPFLELRTRPARFALACYLLEIVDRMAPEGGASRDLHQLFRFTVEALQMIANSEPDARLRLILEARALNALGLRPELQLCVGCGSEALATAARARTTVAFRVTDGGVMCGACALRSEGLLPVHPGTLRTLQQALDMPLKGLDRLGFPSLALAEGQRLMRLFQRFHTGLELRSEPVLEGLLAMPQPSAERPAAPSPPVQPAA